MNVKAFDMGVNEAKADLWMLLDMSLEGMREAAAGLQRELPDDNDFARGYITVVWLALRDREASQ